MQEDLFAEPGDGPNLDNDNNLNTNSNMNQNPPASLPYPAQAPPEPPSSASAFELEPSEFDDVEIGAGQGQTPSKMDRIRRGIKDYSTVSSPGTPSQMDDPELNMARSSSLLAEDLNGVIQGVPQGHGHGLTRSPGTPIESSSSKPTFLTNLDLSAIEQLDADYERALMTREIGWNARYISVRQNSGLSLWSFFVYIIVGVIVFDLNTDWTLEESLLFSMYTITTVGYGKHEIPNSPSLLIFICFYIFTGIAMLTIIAAQLYQWIVLEVTWAQYERDSKKYIKKYNAIQKNNQDLENTINGGMMTIMTGQEVAPRKSFTDKVFDWGIQTVNWVQAYIKDNPSGQLIVVLVPFSLTISIGAAVVGGIEGWNFTESIYFGVVSMTTVGFGDYYPSKVSSTWFCIFWLPFSVGFLSLYLGSVAHLYIDISTRNVVRIEKKLRKRVSRFKQAEDAERAAAIARGTSGGFDMEFNNEEDQGGEMQMQTNSPDHLNQNDSGRKKGRNISRDFLAASYSGESLDEDELSPVRERRENIIFNSTSGNAAEEEGEMELQTMKSMKNVIIAIKQQNMASARRSQRDILDGSGASSSNANPHLSLLSTKQYKTPRGIEKNAPFALRVLVQERFCNIIAHEIAGFQSNVEIKNNTLSVTIDSLKHTSNKWEIPRRARKSFRAVAFEVLYFVGERALIIRGADAVFELTPKEVQGLFAPLLAAFGDADTMEAWLTRTQVMADNELESVVSMDGKRLKFEQIENNRANKITQNMTASPNTKRNVIGNAVKNQ